MIGVIADDLTGAAELAAVGWRCGLRAEVVLANDTEDFPELTSVKADPDSPNLICVDTDSRMCSAAEAEQRVAKAVKTLRRAAADWIYKKVDSVLRGNVAVEVAAVMRETCASAALLVPANPSLGRVIRGGQYFVSGRLLHETEFARDPAHPRLSSNVVTLLGSDSRVRVQSCRLGDELPSEGIIVGDAGSVADLGAWAMQRRKRMALAGGAEYFRALLAAQGCAETPDRTVETLASTDARALFVCGSTSQACQQFVERARTSGIPVIGLPEKLARGEGVDTAELLAIAQKAVAAFAKGHRVILTVGLPLMVEGDRAQKLTLDLVAVAAAILQKARVNHVFAEGGATAAALARSMGWRRLRVVRELSLGVAMMRVNSSSPMLFTMKPGSYVWPDSVWSGR